METAEEEVEQQAAILAQEGVEMDDDMAYALRLEKGLFTLQQVSFFNLSPKNRLTDRFFSPKSGQVTSKPVKSPV
jgi:hypothetical protein